MMLLKNCGFKKEPTRDWMISCGVHQHSYDAQIFMLAL